MVASLLVYEQLYVPKSNDSKINSKKNYGPRAADTTDSDNLAECSIDGSWKIDGNEIVSDR